MPLVDDLEVPRDEAEMERRRFLVLLGSSALGLTGLGTAIATLRYLEPDVVSDEDTQFEVGRPETIPPGTVVMSRARKAYVVHAARGFYALSAVCTHLGCVTRHDPEQDVIVCPCHGSTFDLAGRVTGGPARAPLRRLELRLRAGVLVVDTARTADGEALLGA